MKTTPTIVDDLNYPIGVTVDTSGNLYVSNFYSNEVTAYDSEGEQLGFRVGGFLDLNSVAVH